MVNRECGPDQAPGVYPFIATALAMRLEGPEATLVEGLSGDPLQHQIVHALRTLVGATARRAPLVLVFEDLHWSDQASTAALEELLGLAEDHPILYVLVARPDTQAQSRRCARRSRRSTPTVTPASASGRCRDRPVPA
jgi:hypothetical protein